MHTFKNCFKAYTWLMAAVFALFLAACGSSGGGGDSAPAAGTLGVSLTDAPACGFDAVNVTVVKVRVHQSSSASDTDAGWTDITLSPARKINLINLTNGVLDRLGETPLAAGHYTQLRLVLDPNTGAGLSNSVVPTGGVETPLVTPSAVQSGEKSVGIGQVQARTACVSRARRLQRARGSDDPAGTAPVDVCTPGSKMRSPLRPAAFAWYMAISAFLSSSFALCA